MSESKTYEFLGDIPTAIRDRAISDLKSSGGLRKTSFLAVTQPYAETTEGLLVHIIAGPWVDVDDAVDDFMDRISDRPFLAECPRNLLLEDNPAGGIFDIVKSPNIGPMISLCRNLLVVVLANLDFTKASESFRSTFWTSIQAANFRLQALEIVQCTLSARQLGWLISIIAKEQIDKLRICGIVFSEENGAVPQALRTAAKRPLHVKELNISIISFNSVHVFTVLLNLHNSTFGIHELDVDARHITPAIMLMINDFLRHQHVEILYFNVPISVTIENPYQLQNTPIRLTGLKEFHFTCPIMNGIWNVGLLTLYRATLQGYRDTGLNWIHPGLYFYQDYASTEDVMYAPVPEPHELWTSIETLMAARPDIRHLVVSVGWFSKDNRVHGGRFHHDALQDPASSPTLLRDYHLVSLGSEESRRQLLRRTVWRLFSKMLPRLVPQNGPLAELLFEIGCNDGQVPADIAPFSGSL
ncbi:hypothetical protein CPB85DRAFT_1436008 [Mucidula mucida]|nr:hypothetical protein CPB85DRAFT_1436008 [Mucidula mucida]